LLLGATFAVVGCTDFAEDIREVGEKVDKVDNKVDNNVADITVNTDAIEAKISEMEAQHAADKKAAEDALAALETKLNGKIKADIEVAEAKLTAAYEKADEAIKATAAADKAELKGDVQKAVSDAALALATAKAELEAAYKAADEEIKKAYAEADANLKSDLEAKIATLKADLQKADADNKALLEGKITALETALTTAKTEINASIVALQNNLEKQITAVDSNVKLLQTRIDGIETAYKAADEALKDGYTSADNLIKTELNNKIDNLETALKSADTAMQAKLEGDIKTLKENLEKADADNKAELIKKVEDLAKELKDADKLNREQLDAKIDALATELREADANNKKALEDAMAALEKTLKATDEEIKTALKDSVAMLRAEYIAADVALETKLQANIDKAVADAASALATAVADLTAAYQAADAALDAAIKENAKNIEENAKAIEELKDADDKLNAAILEVADARKIGDAVLEQKIKDEAIARAEAMQALQMANYASVQSLTSMINVNAAAIEAEKVAREAAEAVLQQNIDAVAADLAKARADFEQADKDLKALIDKNAGDIAANLDEIVKLQGRATALEGRAAALESWQTAAMAEIAANASAISGLKTDLANLETAYKAADALLQQNIDKVAGDLATFETEVAAAFKKAADDLAAAQTAINNTISALETKINGELTTLTNTVATVKSELTGLINANKALIEAETSAREAADNAINAAIKALDDAYKAADAANKTALEGQIAAAKTELTAAIDAAKAELNTAITNEATARQNAIDAINTLINGINGDIATINGVNDTQNTRLTDLETKAAQAIADIVSLGNRLTAVEGRLDNAEEDIKELDKLVDSLFNQIQSVVYKPTHADGKARIDYAKLEGAILEGNSVITYKVYPKKHVETIKNAFNKGLLTLVYDLESVTKVGEPALEVISVDKTAKDGELAVTVKASNLGAATFYSDTPSISWSAALVLSYGAENFSTEYTNLVAGVKTDYTFDLYVNDVLYAAAEDQTIEYAATNPELWTKTVLNGLNVKFSDGATKYTPADFFEIYPLAQGMFVEETPEITNPNDLFVPGEDANGYVTAYLNESKVASTNVGEVFNVKYGYTFNGVPKNAEGNIEIVAFPWAIQVAKNDGGATDPLQLPYTDDMVVKVLPDYEITFTDGGTGVKTEKQLVEEGYCVKVDTLDVVTAVTDAKGGATADLFTVAKIDDKEVAPVQVSLAKDNGVNKALAANVGTIFNVKYSFDYKVGTETITAAKSIDADVKIEKTMYSFDIAVPEIQWTFAPDATADAAIAGGYCSRVLEYANDEAGIISAAYRTGSTDKALMNGALTIEEVLAAGSVTEIKVGANTYTGVDIANSPIQFSAGTPADDKVEVQLEKLAWGAYDGQTGKEYVASATYELSSAIVNINLTASTRDRNRNAIEIDLGEKSVVYAANLVVDPTIEIPLGLNDALVANKNLGSATSVDDALLTQVLNAAVATNYVTYVDDAHKRENATAMKTGLQFADALGVACFDKVTYGYHYGNLTNTSLGYTNGSIVPKLYAYSASFTTWYGQVVNVALDFKLEDPNYNFAPVYQYIQGTATDGYYVQVNPEYTYDILEPNKLNDFSVKQVNLNASFDVMNGDVKMDAAAMASASLVKKFEMINNDDANITFADAPVNTIINYSGSKDFVNVNGSLTIENDYSGTKTYYPIAETIFTGDFATFQVHKYDPIAASITVRDNKAEQGVVITDAKIYEFYVLDNFSLKDKLGNELIDPSETDGANAWVVGVPENNISNGVSVATIYDLTATYELKVTSPTTGIVPTGITVDSTNGKITIDNSSQIVFANPVVIQAKVTITYPQGKRESSYVTYTFGDK